MNVRIRYADVAATLALVVAMSGAAYAAGLPRNSVGTKQLQNGAVTSPKIANGAVVGIKIANGTVTGGKLANGAVGTAKLASNAVTSAKIVNNSVSLADLVGGDASGGITFTIAAGACGPLTLSGVTGAKVGQVPLMTFVGTGAIPSNLIFQTLRVTAPGVVLGRVCNVGNANVTNKQLDVRVITFG